MRLFDFHLVVLSRLHAVDDPIASDDPVLATRAGAVMDLTNNKYIKREGRNLALTRKGLKAINGTS